MRLAQRGKSSGVLMSAAAALFLSGCFGAARNIPGPPADQFAGQELKYSLAGTDEAALGSIQKYLARQDLPSELRPGPPRTYLVTSYIEEPSTTGARRVRRSAYRFGTGATAQAASGGCTDVVVASLTISRGIHEEAWSPQPADQSFESTAWPGLKEFLQRSACP